MGGRWQFEGQARGRLLIIGQDGEGREMSVTEFEKEKKKGVEEEEGQKRGERSRALSCRPGSQIRRGLKS